MATQSAPGEGLTACGGQDFKRLIQAGLAWLEQNYETVNALNVFPVPDGDTGTNMMLTMRSAFKEIAESEETHVGRMAKLVYNGALMGARGNSGVILSQLLRGFARGVEDDSAFSAEELARGLHEAARTAYQAVQEPVEGTMLTVAREVAEEAREAVAETTDLLAILDRIVSASRASVDRTPQLLAVLAEAGVVDSGGMGITFILEGMLRYLRGEPLLLERAAVTAGALQSALTPEDEEGYGYDVQFLLKGQDLDVDSIRQHIESIGWSTLVVGDESLVKVHVHVHNPGDVLGYGASLGNLMDVVVENMQEQYEEFVHERGGPTMTPLAYPPQSIEPPPIEEGSIAVVTVAPGEGLTRIFYSLGAGRVISGGQTMNPSTKEIVEAINSLPTDKIVVLPNNKNIVLAAESAAQQVNGKDVRVVVTRSIPEGVTSLLSLDPHGELDEVAAMMAEASRMVETGEVTTSTRNARIDGIKVKEGQVIGLHNDRLSVAGSDVNSVVMELLEKMGAAEMELITLYYGANVRPQDAAALHEHIQDTYPDHEIEMREGGQPHYFYILSVE